MTFNWDETEYIQRAKSIVIHDLFVKTADENYLTARWCFKQKLQIDFKWLALHALEKYLKAALLINGESAKSYSHKLLAAFHALQKIAGSLLPDPDSLIESLLQRLESYGNSHNRYNLYGNVHGSAELDALDLSVFAIRRLICPLNEISDSGQTHRCDLGVDPNFRFSKQNCLLDLALVDHEHPLYDVACDRNMPFASANYQHSDPSNWSIAASSSTIEVMILNPMAGAQCEADARVAASLTDCLISNVILSDYDKAELKSAKKATFSRLCISH